MTTFVRDITVTCPPEHVFDVLSNVERLPEFSEMTVAVRNGPGRAVEAGDTFEQAVKVLGVEFDTEWKVTDVLANQMIKVQGNSQHNGKAALTQRIAAEGSGSRVTFEVDYEPPFGLLGEIADKVVFERRNEEQAEQILARLKALCEGSAAL